LTGLWRRDEPQNLHELRVGLVQSSVAQRANQPLTVTPLDHQSDLLMPFPALTLRSKLIRI
jgi:hypothetical protein